MREIDLEIPFSVVLSSFDGLYICDNMLRLS